MRPDLNTTPEELFIRILTFFSGGARYFTTDMAMADVVNSEFPEKDLWFSVCALEISLGVTVPGEMLDLGQISMTLGEFSRAVAKLPPENDPLQIARFIRAFVEAVESANPEEEEVHREEDPL